MTETPVDVAPVARRFASLRDAVGAVVVGQEAALRQLFVTLLCSSHALVEGVPGVAKTLLVRTLAASLGVRFGRVDCGLSLSHGELGACRGRRESSEREEREAGGYDGALHIWCLSWVS